MIIPIHKDQDMSQALLLPRRKLLGAAASLPLFNIIKSRAQSPCGSFYPSGAPPQAVNAGMTKLKMRDDFNIPGTVATKNGVTSGVNFFLQESAGSTYGATGNVFVNTTLSAANVGNGSNGATSFTSPEGGMCVINGPNGSGNVSMCSTPQSTQGKSNPGFGCWQYFYIHACIQQQVNCSSNGNWWAMWGDSQLSATLPSSLGGGTGFTEVDWEENYCGNFSFANNALTVGVHEWQNGNGTQLASNGGGMNYLNNGVYSPAIADSNFHLYGLLWQQTGTCEGLMTWYYDNVAVTGYGGPISWKTGTGGDKGFDWLDAGGPIYLKFGGPAGYNMYIDYVEVYQAA